MGSSGGSSSSRPPAEIPPPSGLLTPTSTPPTYQTAAGQPFVPPVFPSFLPSDPRSMATGLTPGMLAAIAGEGGGGGVGAAGGAAAPTATGSPVEQQQQDPRATLALAMALAAEEQARAPENRAGGRMPWDEEAGAFIRNPDWRPTNRAGMRASSPGYGGRASYGGSLT